MNNQNNNKFNNNFNEFNNVDVNDINITPSTHNELKINENGIISNLDGFNFEPKLRIKVFGIGGAGNNIISHMAKNSDIDASSLIAINTDYQVLKKMQKQGHSVILIGKNTTKGYGSGSDPIIGEKAANEDRAIIENLLKDVDLLFIVSGMGKGTGTGASPIVAEIARKLNILTISIVNVPSLQIEGQAIYDTGLVGLNNLKKYVNGLATINNDKIIGNNSQDKLLFNCFEKSNQVISDTITNLIHTINEPCHINIDFNDIKNFFKEKTNFQIINCELDSNDNSSEILKEKISSTLFDEKIIDSKKGILTLKLNESVPSNFISDIRKVIEELTQNKEFNLIYSIDNSPNIKFAKLSILLATNDQYYQNTNTIESLKESNNEFILNLEQKINEINELEINQPIIQEQTPPAIELNKEVDLEEKGIDEILKAANEFNVEINNNNPNKIIEENKYNLNEIDVHQSNYQILTEELKKVEKTLKNYDTSSRLSKQLSSNQTSIRSTVLQNFISKTLPFISNSSNTKKVKIEN